MDDRSLNQILNSIPCLEQPLRIEHLVGGLTNTNYRIETTTATYLLRVSDPITGLLAIDRDNERVNTERAHLAGVGPSLIYSLKNEQVLLVEWIEARTLHSDYIIQHPGILDRMAASIRRLHHGPAFQGEFYFPVIRQRYLTTVIKNKWYLPDEYLKLEPLVSELEKALALQPENWVPCNNDLLAENFMDDGQKIWIIDYEYGGQNEASFELGNLASESFLSDELLVSLCDAYWQQHLPSKISRAMAWSMIARFGWVLWASIQEAISPLDFDFRSWGRRKWDSVVPELTGSRHQKVLNELIHTTV